MCSDFRAIPLVEPDFRGNEEEYLIDCVRTGWVSSAGPYVLKIEERLSALSSVAHTIATTSGTTAIQLLLATLGIGHGCRVVVPDWTFAATANAVIHAGAIPVFVDVDPYSWCLDPGLLEDELAAAAKSANPIAAVIAVDPLGLPADYDTLLEVCRFHSVTLIEDAAGSLGSKYKGRPAGGLADAGIFSFNGNKIVTGGGGGAIVTNNSDWAKRARHLSSQARSNNDDYVYDSVGCNYRLTNLNAAVILAQLERLSYIMESRQRISKSYSSALIARSDLLPPPSPLCAEWNGWMYVVRTASAEDADSLVRHLQSLRIGARKFWNSLSCQLPYTNYPHRLRGVSVALSGCHVSLPNSSLLTDSDLKRIVGGLNSWRGRSIPSTHAPVLTGLV